jgi:outer membrane protein TolC
MKNKQWYRLIAVEVVSLAWPLVGFAQQPQSLTLSEAIELALKSNRQLQAAQQYTDAAKGAAGQAKGAFFPRLDMIEGFNYTDKPTLVFSNLLDQSSFKQKNFAIGSLNNPTPLTNLASQIRLEQPLYAGENCPRTLGKLRHLPNRLKKRHAEPARKLLLQ